MTSLLNLPVVQWGQTHKSPLVVLAGWAMPISVLTPLTTLLIKDYCIYGIDLSILPPSATPSTLNQLVEQLAQQLPQPARWLGWSFGGQLATLVAYHYPEQVTALLTLCSTPCWGVTDHWSAGLAATQLKAFKARFRTNPTITLQRFLALISRHCAVNTLACLQAHASQQTINYPLLNRLLDWLLALNGCPLIARLTQPGLHILADRDPLIPQQTAQHIQLLNPQQQAMRLRQVGHTPFISHSRQIAQLINDFDNDRLG